ncbi:MAG: hypothetical protein GY737_12660 [Desulfobacteraceae bacterium]|nr:hypothetical protein [Desulfobacteraceae bacterium]
MKKLSVFLSTVVLVFVVVEFVLTIGVKAHASVYYAHLDSSSSTYTYGSALFLSSFGDVLSNHVGEVDLRVDVQPKKLRYESVKYKSVPEKVNLSGEFRSGIGEPLIPISLEFTYWYQLNTKFSSNDLNLTPLVGGRFKVEDFRWHHYDYIYEITVNGTWEASGPTETTSGTINSYAGRSGINGYIFTKINQDGADLFFEDFNVFGLTAAGAIPFQIDTTIDGISIYLECNDVVHRNLARRVPLIIPIPGSIWLLGAGLLVGFRKKFKK